VVGSIPREEVWRLRNDIGISFEHEHDPDFPPFAHTPCRSMQLQDIEPETASRAGPTHESTSIGFGILSMSFTKALLKSHARQQH
jgi:hypothetical protein